MTAIEFALKAAERIALSKRIAQSFAVSRLADENKRRRWNEFYLRRNLREKAAIYGLFGKLFTDNAHPAPNEGEWRVNFADAEVRIPLRRETFGLDWDSAMSAAGHDIDVKQAYSMLLASDRPPKVFFDIGANYGMHSLLFAANGVRTISFEPNPLCVQYLNEMFRYNGLYPEVECIALSDRAGESVLAFPRSATWLGTLEESTAERLSEEHDLTKVAVQLETLDSYVERSGLNPDLIKIDTEGHELNVLRGGRNTLRNFHPVVLFESTDKSLRPDLFDLLRSCGYSVLQLSPYGLKLKLLATTEFQEDPHHNFAAMVADDVSKWT